MAGLLAMRIFVGIAASDAVEYMEHLAYARPSEAQVEGETQIADGALDCIWTGIGVDPDLIFVDDSESESEFDNESDPGFDNEMRL